MSEQYSGQTYKIILIDARKNDMKNENILSNNGYQNNQKSTQQKLPIKIDKQKHPQNDPIIMETQQDNNRVEYTPISVLNPMMQRWIIKAIVYFKSQKRPLEKTGGNSKKGYFFNIDIADASAKINCVFFNDACEKFFNIIEQNKVYEFSKAFVKQNRYSSGNQNAYQLTFEKDAVIHEIQDDQSINLSYTLDLVKIKIILEKPLKSLVDCWGVVFDSSPITQVKLKNGEWKSTKSFTIFDQDQIGIEVKLWGTQADEANYKKNQILCLRNMRVYEYNNQRFLQGSQNSEIIVDQQTLWKFPNYQDIDNWVSQYHDRIKIEKKQADQSFQVKSLQQLNQESIDNKFDTHQKKFCEVRVFITGINTKNTLTYPSCIKCPRKLEKNMDQWRCKQCDMDVSEPNYRYIVTLKAVDSSGQLWLTVHDHIVTQINEISAKQFLELSEEDFKIRLKKKFTNIEKRILISSKNEYHSGQIRTTHTLEKILPNDYAKETKVTLTQIKNMSI